MKQSEATQDMEDNENTNMQGQFDIKKEDVFLMYIEVDKSPGPVGI